MYGIPDKSTAGAQGSAPCGGWTVYRREVLPTGSEVIVYSSGRIVRPSRWDMRDFAPSRDIAHAWEVVAKLAKDHPAFVLTRGLAGTWFAELRETTAKHGNSLESCGSTAELAICRVALLHADALGEVDLETPGGR